MRKEKKRTERDAFYLITEPGDVFKAKGAQLPCPDEAGRRGDGNNGRLREAVRVHGRQNSKTTSRCQAGHRGPPGIFICYIQIGSVFSLARLEFEKSLWCQAMSPPLFTKNPVRCPSANSASDRAEGNAAKKTHAIGHFSVRLLGNNSVHFV